jgi:hypothetical protein
MDDDRPRAPTYGPAITIPSTKRSHALGNYPPPPRCPAHRRDLHTFYIRCRSDPHPAAQGTDDEGHRWLPVEP